MPSGRRHIRLVHEVERELVQQAARPGPPANFAPFQRRSQDVLGAIGAQDDAVPRKPHLAPGACTETQVCRHLLTSLNRLISSENEGRQIEGFAKDTLSNEDRRHRKIVGDAQLAIVGPAVSEEVRHRIVLRAVHHRVRPSLQDKS